MADARVLGLPPGVYRVAILGIPAGTTPFREPLK
jgi:hypothetical protein